MKRNTSSRSYFCDWYEKYCILLDVMILIAAMGIYSIIALVIEGNIDFIGIIVPAGITWLVAHTVLIIVSAESAEAKRKIEKKDKGG